MTKFPRPARWCPQYPAFICQNPLLTAAARKVKNPANLSQNGRGAFLDRAGLSSVMAVCTYAACECETAWSIHSENSCAISVISPRNFPPSAPARMRTAANSSADQRSVMRAHFSPIEIFRSRAQPSLSRSRSHSACVQLRANRVRTSSNVCLLPGKCRSEATTWMEPGVPAISAYDESDMLEIFFLLFSLAILKLLLRTYTH